MSYGGKVQWDIDPNGNLIAVDQNTGKVLVTQSVYQSTLQSPSVPQNVLALAGNGKVFVYWNSGNPASTSPVLYTITINPGSIVKTVQGAGQFNQAVVTGVPNGVAITASVTATSVNGTSGPSTPSNVVTPNATATNTIGVSVPSLADNIVTWFSARLQTGATNGSTINVLTDQSGNGYNFANTGSSEPGFLPGTWTSSWSSGKPAATLAGTNQGWTTNLSGLMPGMYGPQATVAVVYDVSAQPNANSSYYGRVISADGGANPLFNPNITIPRGWDISLTPTANSGTNYCTTVTSNNFVLVNGVSINSGTIQSAQITGLNVAQLAICTIPGVLYLSQNGGGSWATVTPALQPVCDGLYQLPNDVPAGYAWTLGGIQNNGFNATLQGHIAEVIIWNRVLNSTEILALQTYLATAK